MEKSSNIAKENTTENTIGGEIASEIQNQMIPEAAHELSLNIIRAGVILILYIIIKIALKFVTALANLIAKLPILEQFNKLGGILYGAIRGLLIIYVALLIIQFVGEVNPKDIAQEEIEKSIIGKEMYERNVIELLVR